jgi:hypothetical protein
MTRRAGERVHLPETFCPQTRAPGYRYVSPVVLSPRPHQPCEVNVPRQTKSDVRGWGNLL